MAAAFPNSGSDDFAPFSNRPSLHPPVPAHGAPDSARVFLRQLLDYEIRGAMRYRRFLSLILLKHAADPSALRTLDDLFRSSDELIVYGDGTLAVIMRDTDADAAAVALDRALAGETGGGRDLRAALASYPADGCDGIELLQVAEHRLSLMLMQMRHSRDDAPRDDA